MMVTNDNRAHDELKAEDETHATQSGKGSDMHQEEWDGISCPYHYFLWGHVPSECETCGSSMYLAASVMGEKYGSPWTVHSMCHGCDNHAIVEVDY